MAIRVNTDVLGSEDHPNGVSFEVIDTDLLIYDEDGNGIAVYSRWNSARLLDEPVEEKRSKVYVG